MKKDCMFQYHNSSKGESLVEDTGLITLPEAIELFDKYYKEAFISVIRGDEVQMVIWCNCSDSSDYSIMYADMDSRDIKVIGGRLYKVEPLDKKDFFIEGLEELNNEQ